MSLLSPVTEEDYVNPGGRVRKPYSASFSCEARTPKPGYNENQDSTSQSNGWNRTPRKQQSEYSSKPAKRNRSLGRGKMELFQIMSDVDTKLPPESGDSYSLITPRNSTLLEKDVTATPSTVRFLNQSDDMDSFSAKFNSNFEILERLNAIESSISSIANKSDKNTNSMPSTQQMIQMPFKEDTKCSLNFENQLIPQHIKKLNLSEYGARGLADGISPRENSHNTDQNTASGKLVKDLTRTIPIMSSQAAPMKSLNHIPTSVCLNKAAMDFSVFLNNSDLNKSFDTSRQSFTETPRLQQVFPVTQHQQNSLPNSNCNQQPPSPQVQKPYSENSKDSDLSNTSALLYQVQHGMVTKQQENSAFQLYQSNQELHAPRDTVLFNNCQNCSKGGNPPCTNKFDFTRPDKTTNLRLQVDGTRLFIHKEVMSAWSNRWRHLVRVNSATCDEITLRDTTLQTVLVLLDFIYGIHKTISETNVYPLLELANKFEMPKIKKECEDFLLTMEADMKLLVVSQNYRLQHLYKKCLVMATNESLSNLERDPLFSQLNATTTASIYKAEILRLRSSARVAEQQRQNSQHQAEKTKKRNENLKGKFKEIIQQWSERRNRCYKHYQMVGDDPKFSCAECNERVFNQVKQICDRQQSTGRNGLLNVSMISDNGTD